MKLVTFGINEKGNLIVQFPIFVQTYIQVQLILYQIEMAPVYIIDLNKKAHSYAHLQEDRPYTALNSEACISLRHQEFRTCKNIGYKFYYEELFVVKQKSKYTCESSTYFNLGAENIEENCNFAYYFNKIDIKPLVLDGGNEIILVNLPNNKHIECNVNNDIPVKYPASLMFYQTKVCYATVKSKQKIIFFYNCDIEYYG